MILVVDDIRDGADALCQLLRAKGYPCQYAAGGREALAVIRAHPASVPILVVLDEMMPDVCGIQVVQQLRADPAVAQTPVVMFSAGLNLHKREAAMKLGILDWIVKGIDVNSTASAIGDHYERVGGVRSLGAAIHPWGPYPSHGQV